MSLPKPNKQSTVVITGASSGIGTELAKGLARRGFPLMLVARRRERLDELAQQLRDSDKIEIEVLPLDLSDAGSRAQLTASCEMGSLMCCKTAKSTLLGAQW